MSVSILFCVYGPVFDAIPFNPLMESVEGMGLDIPLPDEEHYGQHPGLCEECWEFRQSEHHGSW